MPLGKIADKVVETDVLIIGGGMAGCTAAAKAREHGLDVTIVEKSHTSRSGSAAAGLDHNNVAHLDNLKGISVTDIVTSFENRQMVIQGYGRWGNPNILAKALEKGQWVTEQLESMGISHKWDDGDYYFIPGVWFDGVRMVMRVHWQNIKPMLASVAKKRGARVLERTMIIDLLTDNGRITGATAVNVRTGEFIVIKAKAVITATGTFARCYKPETPVAWNYQLRYHMCPASVSGDGWAMAYRAGAELSNMDITGWAFRIRDDPTISFGNFTWNDGITAKYFTWTGEEFGYTTAAKYDELENKGLTPLYNSIEHLPDDYHKRMEIAYADERLVSFKIAEDRGFNPRTHKYEMMPNMPHCFQGPQGVAVDEDSMTSVKGLFAIGGCASGYLGGVLFSGLTIGDNIKDFINGADEPVVDKEQVESQKQSALLPLTIKDGPEPLELEAATRYICERYVGQFKAEGKLQEGLRRLGSIRREFLPKLMATNPHHLMRAIEVRNVMDLAEVHMNGVMARKETRGNHIRLDYPERDKSLDHMITYQRLENGKPVLERREAPALSSEYDDK